MRALAIALCAVFVLSGCTAPKTTPATKGIFIKPPAMALMCVKPVTPPDPLQLQSLEGPDRERLLMKKIDEMQDALFDYHVSSKALHSWIKKQEQIYPADGK